ncbi:hypothetical protein SDC9_119870 [bioreactor metagenome]|uniref:Uncharacterized protein n=1 Tax=bioreactor metagenome TaxID=1076179 RepID=A0A645C9K3_9ZZZZ
MNQVLFTRAAHGNKFCRHAVAVGDGTGFVEDHRVHVSADFHGLTGHGDNIKACHTVHTGDTDSRQQPADGRGDQAYGQGNQCGYLQANTTIYCDGIEADDHDQEDNCQTDQQRIQRDLVGRFLTGRSFHQCDHFIKKGFAGVRHDSDFEPVADYRCAAGDR